MPYDRIPGPGAYDYEGADSLVKPRGSEVDFESKIGRQNVQADPKLGPGFYNVKTDFA